MDDCLGCGGLTQEELLDQTMDKIQKYGWAVTMVGGGNGEQPFAYTAGLSLRSPEQPELIMVGFDPMFMGEILNMVVMQCDRDEFRFSPESDGEKVRLGDAPQPVMLRLNPHWNAPITFAHLARRRMGLDEKCDVLQVIASDPEGRFPDDVGYEKKYLIQNKLPSAE